MITAVPDILARIVDRKRSELPAVRQRAAEFERRAEDRTGRRDFEAAVRKTPAIIAEIKKASPSKGLLAKDFVPAAIASAYAGNGAAALSVLTDRDFFQGSLDDLEAARAVCKLPVLRKDFTIDTVQIAEAAAHNADAILLIAAILTGRQLREFREEATRFGLAALVEVHDEDELERAKDSGATIIGVNNRNLRTFELTLDTSLRLAERMPPGVVRVSESGIHSRRDVETLRAAGYCAFLVGERLMTSGDPGPALRELLA